jgi:mono/diheme cytochrome c family protein
MFRLRAHLRLLGIAARTTYCTGLIVALLTAASLTKADDDSARWVAPPDARKVQNPIKPTPETLAEGAHLFKLNCAGCHGVKGDGNGAAAEGLPKKPANFTDVKMMKEATDGELFWKITTGRPPMPTWESLPENQRWELVNYIRTFAKTGAKTP